jgi:hypothetical protein
MSQILSTEQEARQRMVEHLQLLHDVLATTPMAGRYWLIGGVVLGWARERQVLAHDAIDADFAFLGEDLDVLESCFPALTAAGFRLRYRFPGLFGPATEYSFVRGDAKLEFFRVDVVGDRFRYSNFGHVGGVETVQNICEIPAQPLEGIDFAGRRWLKARDHDAELTALYGDWRTPNPDWDYLQGPATVERRPWDASTYDLDRC